MNQVGSDWLQYDGSAGTTGGRNPVFEASQIPVLHAHVLRLIHVCFRKKNRVSVPLSEEMDLSPL
jgi:hypothetical protein